MKEKSTDRLGLAQSIYQEALKAGFDNCGIISLDDMETFDARLIDRMEAVPESQPFYDSIRMNADIRKRYPWAKSLVICTTWYGKYRYPEQLQGRYAKVFSYQQGFLRKTMRHAQNRTTRISRGFPNTKKPADFASTGNLHFLPIL